MKDIMNNIDAELWKAVRESPFNRIDYENLLAHDPAKIRKEEMDLFLKEKPVDIPQHLDVEDIWIPSSHASGKIRLRMYRPKGKKDLPVLLYFHGGAFIYGTPEQYDFIFFRLALDAEMIILSVDYRLAPEYQFPAGMEDGCDALLWLAANAEQIGGDKNNMMIGGSSAGATIAASVTHWARDRKEVEIRHQYMLYPPMSHLLETSSMRELEHAPQQTKRAAEWMWKHYLQNGMMYPPKYAVPLLEDNFKDLPNATIIVCELDPLKDEGKMYAQKLQEAGVFVNVFEIAGAVHCFDFFPCSLSDTFYEQQVQLFRHILDQKK